MCFFMKKLIRMLVVMILMTVIVIPNFLKQNNRRTFLNEEQIAIFNRSKNIYLKFNTLKNNTRYTKFNIFT